MFGINNVDYCVRFCYVLIVFGFKVVFGVGVMMNIYRDIEEVNVIFIIGYNFVEIYLVGFCYVFKVKERGVKVIVVDLCFIRIVWFVDIYL